MKWKNKKVLVTGGAGVIGKELVHILAQKGAELTVLDIKPRPTNIPQDVKYFQVDISEIDPSLIIDQNPELIFHLAATFERTKESPEMWESNFKNNVLLSHRVINTTLKRNLNLQQNYLEILYPSRQEFTEFMALVREI